MHEQTQITEEPRKGRDPARRDAGGRWQAALIMTALIAGFAGIIWMVFREQLTPSVPVQTEAVVLLNEEVSSSTSASFESEMLFQASGWTEPDPWPIKVAVLTSGFVESITVREGEAVTNGQVLARLDAADARLEQSEALAAEAAAKASLKIAMDSWKRIKDLQEHDTSQSEQVQVQSELDLSRARLDAARVKREMADLALERTVIRAPMDGVVLRRYVEPGSKRSPTVDDPNSAVIVSLFDPAQLQVRVDVPIAEAGKLTISQPVRVSTALLPGKTISGKVTSIVGEADLQRNTLQVKVALYNPDPRLRPEVLCRAEFWSTTAETVTAKAGHLPESSRHSLWVSEAALNDKKNDNPELWVIDLLTSTAHLRAVKLGTERREGYRHVLDGLRANELVVTSNTDALQEGRRVTLSESRKEQP